jgi:peroxiredoxin
VSGVRDLGPGDAFPDLELPDADGHLRRLSELAAGDPLLLHTYRGWWCPKERAWFRHLVALQEDAEVAYTRFASLSVDPPETSAAFRAGLDARWPFLSDVGGVALEGLGLRETTDSRARPVPADGVAARARPAGAPVVARLLVLGPPEPGGAARRAAGVVCRGAPRLGPAVAMTAWLALLDAPAGELSAPVGGGRVLAGWLGAARRPHPGARRCDPRMLDPHGAAARASLLWPPVEALTLFDDPAVVQARREARRRRSPRCASTFTVDSRHFAGSLWVPAEGDRVEDDPFRLLGRPLVLDVGAGLLGDGTRLAGPAQERYSGAPWPAGA